MTDAQDSPMARRTLLATGTATALTLGNVDFAAAEGRPGREPETRTVRGTLPPAPPTSRTCRSTCRRAYAS